MSLTQSDLKQIRTIVRDEVMVTFDDIGRRTVREETGSIVSTRIDPRFDMLEGRIKALDNDIKDIYKMISTLQKLTRQAAHFEKYDLEQKVLKTYKNILAIAKEAGIILPKV